MGQLLETVSEFIAKHGVCTVLLPQGNKPLQLEVGAHEGWLNMESNRTRPMICIGRCNFANEAWNCLSPAYQRFVAKVADRIGADIEIIDYC